MPQDYFAVLARYNAWANRRLYQACETLTPADYLKERASSYGSLHATLNHALMTDRVWIARIEGHTPSLIDENQILYADLLALKIARLAEDERLRNLIGALPETAMALPIRYIDRRGDRVEAPLQLVLAHLFDAQSRSRGEVQALLAQAGVRAPSLDFLFFMREGGGTVGV